MKEEIKKGFDIHHSQTVEKLPLSARLQILWNGYVKTESTITVDKEVEILSSKGMLVTKDIFPKKEKLIGEMEINENLNP